MPSQTLLRDVGWKLQEHRPDYANLTRLLSSSLAKDRGKPGPNISNHAPFIGVGTQSLADPDISNDIASADLGITSQQHRAERLQPDCVGGCRTQLHENLAERRFPPDYTQVLRDNTAETDDKASPRARPHVATRCRGRRSPWQGVSAGGPALGHERFVKALPWATGPVARLCHGRQGLWRRLAVDLVATDGQAFARPRRGRPAFSKALPVAAGPLARPCQGAARLTKPTEHGRPGHSQIVAKGRAPGKLCRGLAGPC